MRRSILITLATVGSLVCLLGGTGLFAALNDSATTAQNRVESGEQPGSVNLQLAPWTGSGCGEFTDDLDTAFFDASGLQPNGNGPSSQFCVRNHGSQVAALTVEAFALSDTETGCTGDELDYDALSCGTGDGELSAVVVIRFDQTNCVDQYDGIVASRNLGELVGNALPLADLQPDVAACYAAMAFIPVDAPGDAVQRAQTDQSVWRFRFLGSVATP